MNIEVNGTTLPVNPLFTPVCTLDSEGRPVPLTTSGGGAPSGGATEAKQTEQMAQAGVHFFSEMALYGSDFIADTAAHSGNYLGLIVIADAEISALTLGASSSGSAALTGIPLSAGQQILANVTSITLNSGVIQLIKAPTPFPA